MRNRLPLSQVLRSRTGHNDPRNRLLSPGQLELARQLNTLGDHYRRQVLDGFGDAAPPDPRPKAPVIPFARRRR